MPSSRTSDAGIAKLYQLPPGEFTAARNALAKRLKNEGDRDGAALVAALAKPNLSSWAVNQNLLARPARVRRASRSR